MRILLVLIMFLFSVPAHAEQKNTMPTGDAPTKINSDTMQYNAENNTVTFTGDVVVERAGFNLWAKEVVVYLKDTDAKTDVETKENDPMGSMKSGDIDRIVAEKDVRMKYNTYTGKSSKAIYLADKALLTMYGNPILKDGDNSITGQEIRYYLNENRSEVIGGSKRVEAFFSSDK